MNVSIFDQDALLIPRYFRYNLEVMKLSTYYKGKKDIVNLLLDANDYERYNKVIIRKTKIDKHYPTLMIGKPNVEYGGLAFTNNIYKALPEDIENCIPDYSIYDKYFKLISANRSLGRQKLINSDKKSSLIRLSTNNIDCNSNFREQINFNQKRIVIFDNNISSLKDYIEVISEIGKDKKMSFTELLEINKRDELERFFEKIYVDGYSYVNFTKKINTNSEYLELLNLSRNNHNRISFSFGAGIKTDAEFVYEMEVILNRMMYNKFNGYSIHFFKADSFIKKTYKTMASLVQEWNNGFYTNSSIMSYTHKHNLTGYYFLIQVQRQYPVLYKYLNTIPNDIRDKGGIWML